MKYLNDYMDEAQTDAFNKAGAFFAFGQKQYNEKAKKGVAYVNMGAGLVCMKDKSDWLSKELDTIYTNAIDLDIKENGKKAIIHREFANHECQITMDITACVEKLEYYPITKDEIRAEWKEYFEKCCDNDWF